MPATVETIAPAPELVRFLIDHVDEAGGCKSGATLLPPDETGDGAPEYDAEASALVEDLRRAMADKDGPVFRLESGREAQHWFERVVRSAGIAVLRVAARRAGEPHLPGWPAPQRVGATRDPLAQSC